MDSSGTTVWLASSKIDETDAKWTLTEVWIEAGKISESEPIAGADGLKTKTIVWQMIEGDAPSGFINAARKVDNIGGAKTITTTYYDNADLISSQVYQSTEPFSLPGVVSWRRLNNGAFSDLILTVKPPISTTAVATVTVTYSTSGGISTPSNFYNPTEHTSVTIYGIGYYYRPFSSTSSYANHIHVAGGTTSSSSVQGNPLYANTVGGISIKGPTYDPAGKTITVSVKNPPTFKLDGVQYYRKEVVTMDIPARP